MSDDPVKPARQDEEPGSSSRPSAPSSDDLHDYLPADNAETEAMLDALMAGPRGVPSPELVARLKQLDDAEQAGRASKPSPWAKGEGVLDKGALPSATRPIEAAAPAPASARPIPLWWVYAAVAAVFVPVIITIVVMRLDAAKQSGAAAVVETAQTATATMPSAAGTAMAAPRATASAVEAADAGAADASAAPAVRPLKPRGRPHGMVDPYEDAATAPPPVNVPTAVPSTNPAPTQLPDPDGLPYQKKQ